MKQFNLEYRELDIEVIHAQKMDFYEYTFLYLMSK